MLQQRQERARLLAFIHELDTLITEMEVAAQDFTMHRDVYDDAVGKLLTVRAHEWSVWHSHGGRGDRGESA